MSLLLSVVARDQVLCLLGTRLSVSLDTWDQVLRNVPSVDRLPNRAWKLGTRLLKFHVFGGHENCIRKHLITFSGSLEIRQYVRQLTPPTPPPLPPSSSRSMNLNQDTREQALKNLPLLDRLPNLTRTPETMLFMNGDV